MNERDIEVNVGDLVKYNEGLFPIGEHSFGQVLSLAHILQDINPDRAGKFEITVEVFNEAFEEDVSFEDIVDVYKPVEDIKGGDLVIYQNDKGEFLGSVTHRLVSSEECSEDKIIIARVRIINAKDLRTFTDIEYVDGDSILKIYRRVE